MHVQATNHFTSATAAVFEALTDPDVLVEKYESLGHSDVTILEHEVTDDDGVRIRSRRVVPLDVPSFARRVLSPKNTVEQTDEWGPADRRGKRTGTWTVVAKGIPVHLGGTLSLAPTKGGGCTLEIEGEAKCGVPLIGGKIAGVVGSNAETTMEAEYEFNLGHLGESA